jgi:hypothetical protein
VAALVILQLDSVSVTTVGIIVGVLFTFWACSTSSWRPGPGRDAGCRRSPRPVPDRGGHRLIRPEETFAGRADILAFLFLTIAIPLMARAFLEKAFNPTWWLGLIAGVVMTGVAFSTAGQFVIENAHVLLVFAGTWVLAHGITDTVRAFDVRLLHEQLEPSGR